MHPIKSAYLCCGDSLNKINYYIKSEYLILVPYLVYSLTRSEQPVCKGLDAGQRMEKQPVIITNRS